MPSGSSILDILIKNRLANGDNEIIANNVNLGTAKVKNFYGAQLFSSTPTTSAPTTFFDDVTGNQDSNMCIRIFHGDLTIGPGVTFTPPYRTKGMFVLVKGNLTMQNGSSVSMTARGSTASGENVYLWGSDYVRAAGGSGGTGVSQTTASGTAYKAGNPGIAGSSLRRSGGGGSGGVAVTLSGPTSVSGNGGTGTSYSGGAGSGGVAIQGGSTSNTPVNATGATGSNGFVRTAQNTNRGATGGSGVVPGAGRYSANSTGTPSTDYTPYNGLTGAGGLLMLVCLNQISFVTAASISSNGAAGSFPDPIPSPEYPIATGGASGGGSVNVLYRTGTLPTLQANGGAATGTTGLIINGGAGGAGTATPETFASITYPKRWLVNSGGMLYYRNFSSSSWEQAPVSGSNAYLQYGMLDGEIQSLTKGEYANLPNFNPSSIELKAYMA